jgi:hypothetical protein
MPVPRTENESDANVLPDPELNPLLNPLLAAHMGRWAEVYFTNPPEKRGQAVAELIRELETISPPAPASVHGLDNERENERTETAEVPESSYTGEPIPGCGACGYTNSVGQRFCGMCGALLETMPEARVPQAAEAAPISGASWSEPEPVPGGNSGEHAMDAEVNYPADTSHDAQVSSWEPSEKEFLHFADETELVADRHRLYVGVVLAILLVLLVYMAWRGTSAITGAADLQPVPSKAIPTAPTASAQPSATPSNSSGDNPPTSPVSGLKQPDPTPRKNQTAAARPAPLVVPAAANTSAIAPELSGAEDLATAETYLNGTQGLNRDSREAARWLWKAVGKGNPTAELALSDLYLRGDGVAKSCDQARLLLDAAARKGARAAAERLRNLQAFGCQ